MTEGMIQLHCYPSTASMAPHILLRELGWPFELLLVDRTQSAHKMTAYLKLNPNGLIPVLTDKALVLYEVAAISLYLCGSHPTAVLVPAAGSAEWAQFYTWLE
jgi:glutathione S-transferase